MSKNGGNRVGNQNWQTPPELFKYLNKTFQFTLDGAASETNALLPKYYSLKNSAFDNVPYGERPFTNPPYEELMPWIELFATWADSTKLPNYALLPCDPSTKWWDLMMKTALTVRLMGPGRVAFVDPETWKPVKGNKGASVLAAFYPRAGNWGEAQITMWDWKKDVYH